MTSEAPGAGAASSPTEPPTEQQITPNNPPTAPFAARAAGLPPEQGRALEDLCDAFEATWRAAGRPDVAAAVAELPATVRAAAVRELIELNV